MCGICLIKNLMARKQTRVKIRCKGDFQIVWVRWLTEEDVWSNTCTRKRIEWTNLRNSTRKLSDAKTRSSIVSLASNLKNYWITRRRMLPKKLWRVWSREKERVCSSQSSNRYQELHKTLPKHKEMMNSHLIILRLCHSPKDQAISPSRFHMVRVPDKLKTV